MDIFFSLVWMKTYYESKTAQNLKADLHINVVLPEEPNMCIKTHMHSQSLFHQTASFRLIGFLHSVKMLHPTSSDSGGVWDAW